MLSKEENEYLCRTGPGTPMGNLLRRYWLPVMLSSEIPDPDCSPVRVRVLSEDLVAFRDTNGSAGLIDAHCPHRGASLFFGRNEDCGVRCVYHGWKFDVTGQCVDMPNEPAESNFKHKIRATAYPCQEHGGVIWAYMGPRNTSPRRSPRSATGSRSSRATSTPCMSTSCIAASRQRRWPRPRLARQEPH